MNDVKLAHEFYLAVTELMENLMTFCPGSLVISDRIP